ncbi:phosphotransferase family protein [Arthrobacter sp. H41]|uniref:phosphotransferase family protein n=1 Tax=Arthrobacter sp. H41 TaxID=1312978 RepID=UPI00047CF2A1|nr:phosphotransferase [Arthrobacter sp. H41]
MGLIPGTVTDSAGRAATVHRAWPRSDGGLTFEAREDDGGLIRAGVIEPSGMATLAPYGKDPVLGELAGTLGDADLVVHRYRKRAVLRVGGGYRKLLPPGKPEPVAAAHRRMRALAASAGVETPGVVLTSPGSVTLSTVRGTSFHDLGRAARGKPSLPNEWKQGWELWSQKWPLLAALPPGAAPAVHSPENEGTTLRQWVERCVEFGQLDVRPEKLKQAAMEVERRLLSGVPQQPVLAHRDLHDKQVLFSAAQGTIGLIDCDTLALAEPALDLANLLVHLEFRREQGVLPRAAEQFASNAISHTASAMAVPTDRLLAYVASTRIRLACVYSFRPPYRSLAEDWARRILDS